MYQAKNPSQDYSAPLVGIFIPEFFIKQGQILIVRTRRLGKSAYRILPLFRDAVPPLFRLAKNALGLPFLATQRQESRFNCRAISLPHELADQLSLPAQG